MRDLDRLDDEALRARAAPFLSGQTRHGLRVDVASGVASLDELSRDLRAVTFTSGRRGLYRLGAPGVLDAEELGTAVARSAGLPVVDVYRASAGELYTALPPYGALLGIDLPDLPSRELRTLLSRFGAPAPAGFADAELGEWAQAAILDRTHAGRQLRAVDAVTGTAARHPGEWAIHGDQLIPLGFPGAWQTGPPDTADIEQSYLDGLRSAVAELRPQFTQMRRAVWHDQTTSALQTRGLA